MPPLPPGASGGFWRLDRWLSAGAYDVRPGRDRVELCGRSRAGRGSGDLPRPGCDPARGRHSRRASGRLRAHVWFVSLLFVERGCLRDGVRRAGRIIKTFILRLLWNIIIVCFFYKNSKILAVIPSIFHSNNVHQKTSINMWMSFLMVFLGRFWTILMPKWSQVWDQSRSQNGP